MAGAVDTHDRSIHGILSSSNGPSHPDIAAALTSAAPIDADRTFGAAAGFGLGAGITSTDVTRCRMYDVVLDDGEPQDEDDQDAQNGLKSSECCLLTQPRRLSDLDFGLSGAASMARLCGH